MAQKFQVERWAELTGGRSQHEIHYGRTRLPAPVASPERQLELVRGQWHIEHGLHSRCDMTLGEDHSQLRMGQAPHVLAILNHTVVGLVARKAKPIWPKLFGDSLPTSSERFLLEERSR